MNILKVIFFMFLICSLNASQIEPNISIKTSGSVTDMVIKDSKLYVATDASSIDIFDIKTKKLISNIKLEKIKDFLGDLIDSKIYSVDIIENKILILSQGTNGGRNLFIYENNQLKNVISDKKRLFIARAKFIDKDKILYSLLSNQLFLYDFKIDKNIYSKQISHSKFSYFALNENKTEVAIADESGNIQIYDTLKGEKIKIHNNYNLDNVFQVDYKNDMIITAGQDRRSVIYSKNNQPYIKESNFLIYVCELSPTSKLGAYSSNENNDVTVFDTKSKKDLYLLTKNKTTLSKIVFLNENELFLASDAKVINYYKLKD